MGKKDAEDFAKTKHKGLPEKAKKKDESVEETPQMHQQRKKPKAVTTLAAAYTKV
jgi:hypothetical protein